MSNQNYFEIYINLIVCNMQ